MNPSLKTPVYANTADIARTIHSFIETIEKRADIDTIAHRRHEKRLHRQWPMVVSRSRMPEDADVCVALHNATEQGLAFLSPSAVDPGELIYIRLFWHDEASLRVPAVARHCTPTSSGYLVGCEFMIAGRESGSTIELPDTFGLLHDPPR